jgi:hypothetical protein
MALSDINIAKLYASLELPIVAGELLQGGQMLDPDEEYAFHEAMSDMQPDAALLCIALCSEQISMMLPKKIPEAEALLEEAGNIIATYGSLWLIRITEGSPVPEEFIIDALKNIPDDLGKIRDLMADLDIQIPHEEVASQFLSIMQAQAEANIVIAETHLEALGIKGAEKDIFGAGESIANDNRVISLLPN